MALTNVMANKLVDQITGYGMTGGNGYYLGLGVDYDPVTETFKELQSTNPEQSDTYAAEYRRVAFSQFMSQAGNPLVGLGQKISVNSQPIMFNVNLGEDAQDNWPAVSWIGIFSADKTAESDGELFAYGQLTEPIVVQFNQVALFKTKDLRISVDLDPGEPENGNIGFNGGSPKQTHETIVANAVTTICDDESIVSAECGIDGTVIMSYGIGTAARLGTTNVHILDSEDMSKAHLLKTIRFTAESYNDPNTEIEVGQTRQLDAEIQDINSWVSSNSGVIDVNDPACLSYEDNVLNVTPKAAGTCRIAAYNTTAVSATSPAVRIYKITAVNPVN